MSGSRSTIPPRSGVLLGMLRLAVGQRDGITRFGNTRRAFLTSLVPLAAFALGGWLLRAGGVRPLTELLATVCMLLAPPVLSYQFARLWQREAAWPRFATAFNWCQLVPPAVAAIVLLSLDLATGGLSNRTAGFGLLLVLVYGFWLHWFVARHGLSLSGGRAMLLVIGVNLGTVAIVLAPRLLLGVARG